MYEDSQRFSEGEEDESSHIVVFNPRSTATYSRDQTDGREDEVRSREPATHTMQRDVGRGSSSLSLGDERAEYSPDDADSHVNIREESIQKILGRLSPNGRKIFLATLNEGKDEMVPPQSFSVPDSDDERELFESILPIRTTDSRQTYPKLLSGVDVFNSPIPASRPKPEMNYASRTGVGYPKLLSDGTIGCQYFQPISTGVCKEDISSEPLGGRPSSGRSVAPTQEHTGSFVRGENYQYITRPGPSQIFRGSDGDMLENYGGRLARPDPIEQYRGKPLENMRPPRPPQQSHNWPIIRIIMMLIYC